MIVFYSRGVTSFKIRKFVKFLLFSGTFCYILARPYEVPEERDARFYEVSLKIILIFINALLHLINDFFDTSVKIKFIHFIKRTLVD